MNNTELKDKYEEMHRKGVTSWFSDGREERETILKMGEPWDNLKVIEIGCGEGDLSYAICKLNGIVTPIDYSSEAISKAIKKYPAETNLVFHNAEYRTIPFKYDRIVMQGVLEHLDNPFTELKWMIDNLLVKGGDVITSSPCFLNPRGIVWMTLDMLGAVMSKTDLHYLNPAQFVGFSHKNKYHIEWHTCDYSWGQDADMVNDLRRRIPLALRDGKIPYNQDKFERFIEWLDSNSFTEGLGATAVYRIQT